MKCLIVLLVGGMALFFSSCQEQSLNPETSPDKSNPAREAVFAADDAHLTLNLADVDDPDAVIPQVILMPSLPDWPTDFFRMQNSSVADNVLSLTVSYSGGCEAHEFQLVVSTTFEDSDSQTLNLTAELFHTPSDDLCDEWVTEVKEFDLSPLHAFLLKKYRDRLCVDTIISIHGDDQKIHRVDYSACSIDF